MMGPRASALRRLRAFLERQGIGQASATARRKRRTRSRLGRSFEHLEDRRLLAVTLSSATDSILESGGTAAVTASISEVNDFDVVVELAASGSAKAAVDYTLSSAQIVVPAGQLSASVVLTAIDDALYEGEESVIVVATAATNEIILGIQAAAVQIVDDDPRPTVFLTANDGNISENGGVARLTAALSAVSGLPVTIDLQFVGTAIPGIDFASASQVVIPAGSLLRTLSISALQDNIDERNETIVARVAAITNAAPSVTERLVTTILDDDPLPNVVLSASSPDFAEDDGAALIGAQLSRPSDQEVVIELAYAGSAQLGTDFLGAAQIRIPPGGLSGFGSVTALPDRLVEGTETVIVQLAAATNAVSVPPKSVTLALQDDDHPPAVTLTQDVALILESGGTATLNATISENWPLDIIVHLGFSGTPLAGTDFTANSMITIPAGSLSGSLTLTAIADDLPEPNETVSVDILEVINGREATPQQATITILDDDLAPQLDLRASPAAIGEAGGVATITARLSSPTGRDVVAELGFSGTATSGGDYVLAASQIVIPAGSTEASVILTARDDELDELDEEITIEVVAATNATVSSPSRVTATILDDDPPPLVTAALDPAQLAEDGGSAAVTATLSTRSSLAVTVQLSFAGTATLGVDYTSSASEIVIPAGSLQQSIVLLVAQDALYELDESIAVAIAAATNARIVDAQPLVAVIQDDDSPPRVTLAMDNVIMPEAAGRVAVTASLSAPSAFAVTVQLGFTGSATPLVDYVYESAQVVIPPGQLQSALSLTALQDRLPEPSETVIVDVIEVDGAVEAGTQRATAIIRDDDPPPTVLLVTDQPAVAEGGRFAALTAGLSTLSGRDVIVRLAYSGTASVGDFAGLPSEILIPAGQRQATIQIRAAADAELEPPEVLVIEILSTTNATAGESRRSELTVVDAAAEFATLSGGFFADLDFDGVRSPGEEFLNGWRVHLVDENGTVVASQTSRDIDRDGDQLIDPLLEQGRYEFNVMPGSYTVRQEAASGWRQTMPVGGPSQLVYDLDQQWDFVTSGQFWENWGGEGEKWLQARNDANRWYFVTTAGSLTRWDGASGAVQGTPLSGTLIAELGPTFHADPNLLIDVPPPRPAHSVVVGGGTEIAGLDFGNLQLATISGQMFHDRNANDVRDVADLPLNGWRVELVDDRGVVVASQLTQDIDLDGDGRIDPATESGWYLFADLEPGLYSVRAVPQPLWRQTVPIDLIAQVAWVLDQQLDFFSSGNFWDNFAGANERWLQAAGNDNTWYYITPAGQLFEWDRVSGPQTATPLSGTLIATLSPRYHTDPQLLIDASPEIGLYIVVVAAGQRASGLDVGAVPVA